MLISQIHFSSKCSNLHLQSWINCSDSIHRCNSSCTELLLMWLEFLFCYNYDIKHLWVTHHQERSPPFNAQSAYYPYAADRVLGYPRLPPSSSRVLPHFFSVLAPGSLHFVFPTQPWSQEEKRWKACVILLIEIWIATRRKWDGKGLI